MMYSLSIVKSSIQSKTMVVRLSLKISLTAEPMVLHISGNIPTGIGIPWYQYNVSYRIAQKMQMLYI